MELVHSLHQRLVLDRLDSTNNIDVDLRAYSHTGTVQDDPFDEWVADAISSAPDINVHHAGKLTSPDIVLYDSSRSNVVGLEVKKLDAKRNGMDPRGLTIDYNSTVPCGTTQIKIDEKVAAIPCYYFFALIFDDQIVTSILCHGDYLNNDFDLHKDSKTSNISTYRFGSYGEASVRHRKMYTFPNPLNSKLPYFPDHHCLILPKSDLDLVDHRYKSKSTHSRLPERGEVQEFVCYSTNPDVPLNVSGVFDACKSRTGKDRVPYMVQI